MKKKKKDFLFRSVHLDNLIYVLKIAWSSSKTFRTSFRHGQKKAAIRNWIDKPRGVFVCCMCVFFCLVIISNIQIRASNPRISVSLPKFVGISFFHQLWNVRWKREKFQKGLLLVLSDWLTMILGCSPQILMWTRQRSLRNGEDWGHRVPFPEPREQKSPLSWVEKGALERIKQDPWVY